MTKALVASFGLSFSLFALVGALPVETLAQASKAAGGAAIDASSGKAPKGSGAVGAEASNPDMRLWSFGECDKNFPYSDSPQHKECVRVVGSEEAKDARATHYCDRSHDKDPAEAARCKQAYFANKSKAQKEGFRADPSNLQPTVAPPPPQTDQAAKIEAVTRALTAPAPDEPAAPASPVAETTPAPAPAPASSISAGNITLGLFIVLLLAAVALRYLRKVGGVKGSAKAGSRTRSG
jgi:hypothetical protein